MRRLALLVLLVALPATLLPPPVAPQVATFDAANWVEQIRQFVQMLVDYALQIETLIQEIEQVVQLVEQVEMMATNLEALEDMAFENPRRLLGDLDQLLGALEGVVYRADPLLLLRYDQLYTPRVAVDLVEEEETRVAQTLATYRSLLAATQEAARYGDTAASSLGNLTLQLENAQGNLEALQAVGAISTEVATELTRSNELQAMAVNALVVRSAHELAEREHAEATFLDWVRRGRFSTPPSPHRAFDPVPGDFRSGR